jgi:effector-binding domain-containing protein
MQSEPSVVERDEQPYVGARATVTMASLPEVADRVPEIFGWLGDQRIPPTGAPFFKYNVIDMETELQVAVGVPVASLLSDVDDELFAAVLPAGRYATVRHVGHPQDLYNVTARLLAWGDEQGLAWDVTDTDAGQAWACRIEVYNTDPAVEPDMNKWETDLFFRLAT